MVGRHFPAVNLFMQHATAKLFHVPHVAMFDKLQPMTFYWFVGLFELAGSQGEHSIAVSARSGKIFIPLSDNPDNGAGGIAMMHGARIESDAED